MTTFNEGFNKSEENPKREVPVAGFEVKGKEIH